MKTPRSGKAELFFNFKKSTSNKKSFSPEEKETEKEEVKKTFSKSSLLKETNEFLKVPKRTKKFEGVVPTKNICFNRYSVLRFKEIENGEERENGENNVIVENVQNKKSRKLGSMGSMRN